MWCVKIRGDGTIVEAKCSPSDDPNILGSDDAWWVPEVDQFWGFGATEAEARQQAEMYRSSVKGKR